MSGRRGDRTGLPLDLGATPKSMLFRVLRVMAMRCGFSCPVVGWGMVCAFVLQYSMIRCVRNWGWQVNQSDF